MNNNPNLIKSSAQSAPAQTPSELANANLELVQQANRALRTLREKLYGDSYPPEAATDRVSGNLARILAEINDELHTAMEQLETIHNRF